MDDHGRKNIAFVSAYDLVIKVHKIQFSNLHYCDLYFRIIKYFMTPTNAYVFINVSKV